MWAPGYFAIGFWAPDYFPPDDGSEPATGLAADRKFVGLMSDVGRGMGF